MSRWPLKVMTFWHPWGGVDEVITCCVGMDPVINPFLLNISATWCAEEEGPYRPALLPENIYLLQWGLWAHWGGWQCPCFQVFSSSSELLARDQHCLWCFPKAPLPLPCLHCSSERHSKMHLLLLLIEEFPFVSLSAQRRVCTKP